MLLMMMMMVMMMMMTPRLRLSQELHVSLRELLLRVTSCKSRGKTREIRRDVSLTHEEDAAVAAEGSLAQ